MTNKIYIDNMKCPCCSTELVESYPSVKKYTNGKNEQLVYLECQDIECSFYVCINFNVKNQLSITDSINILENTVESVRNILTTEINTLKCQTNGG